MEQTITAVGVLADELHTEYEHCASQEARLLLSSAVQHLSVADRQVRRALVAETRVREMAAEIDQKNQEEG